MQPYRDTGIEKVECVGYVEKRMGTCLRTLKLKLKGNENTFPGPDSDRLLCSLKTSPDSHWRAIQDVCSAGENEASHTDIINPTLLKDTVTEGETLTGMRYRDEILDPYVHPYAGAIGNDFILMDDNARTDRVVTVEEYLEGRGLDRMKCSS
ncbi:DDE_3 domain-containing protein [Trichonephila clavipes]|nr:DDE_3 domain-containing protein [Trichonephila clavipes]